MPGNSVPSAFGTSNFDEHRARRRIERVRGARDSAGEAAAGNMRHGQRRRLSNANGDEPPLQIAVRARKNRHFGQRLHRAQQLDVVLGRSALHAHHREPRQAVLLRVGFRPQRGLALLQR